jgi:hypothetical protein
MCCTFNIGSKFADKLEKCELKCTHVLQGKPVHHKKHKRN